jgi:regulatory protein
MSARLVRIDDAGPDRKARRLFFDDGEEPRLTSAAVVKKLGLEPDAAFDPKVLEALISDAEAPLAKERALRLLGYRDRSVAELTRKLHDSGYPHRLVRSIVERLVELGLVDDGRFAASWTRTRLASGVGARRIARELAQKGISPEIAQAVVAEECPPDQSLRLAVRSLRGAVATDRKGRDRLVRRLVAKGHDISTAIEAVRSVSETQETDTSADHPSDQ